MNSDTNNNESYRAGSDSSLVNLKKTASFSAKKKHSQLPSEKNDYSHDSQAKQDVSRSGTLEDDEYPSTSRYTNEQDRDLVFKMQNNILANAGTFKKEIMELNEAYESPQKVEHKILGEENPFIQDSDKKEKSSQLRKNLASMRQRGLTLSTPGQNINLNEFEDVSAYDRDSLWGHKMNIDGRIRNYHILMDETTTNKRTETEYAWDISKDPISDTGTGLSPHPILNNIDRDHGGSTSNDIFIAAEMTESSIGGIGPRISNYSEKNPSYKRGKGVRSGLVSTKSGNKMKAFKGYESTQVSTKNENKKKIDFKPVLKNQNSAETFGNYEEEDFININNAEVLAQASHIKPAQSSPTLHFNKIMHPGEPNYGEELQNSPHFPALAFEHSNNKEMARQAKNFLEGNNNPSEKNFGQYTDEERNEFQSRGEEEANRRINNMRKLQFDFVAEDANIEDYEAAYNEGELSTARRELDEKLMNDQNPPSDIQPYNDEKSRISIVEIIDEDDNNYGPENDQSIEEEEKQEKKKYVIPKYRSYEASLKMRKQLDFVNFGDTLQIREKAL